MTSIWTVWSGRPAWSGRHKAWCASRGSWRFGAAVVAFALLPCAGLSSTLARPTVPQTTRATTGLGNERGSRSGDEKRLSELTLSEFLPGVACVSSTWCTAVGARDESSHLVTLAELWNGAHWLIEKTPNPAGPNGFLSGVACLSRTDCRAVGDYISGPSEMSLEESWNGSDWSIQPIPLPMGATSSQLEAVACSSAAFCTAVGHYKIAEGAQIAYSGAWSGATWSVRATPLPTGTTYSDLDAVTCSSAVYCLAVGDYRVGSGNYLPLIEVWKGKTWEVERAPYPKYALGLQLNGSSCRSQRQCTVVGGYYDESQGASVALAESLLGTTWSVEQASNVSHAQSSDLHAVSCASGVLCVAVGGYVGRAGSSEALAETWNGSGWAVRATPDPPNATQIILDDVSCVSAMACIAVGGYRQSGGADSALVETWNGKAWSIVPPG
jgi:hypothetical protein